MSLIITVCSTQEFRRLATSGNTSAKWDDNAVGLTSYWYSSTPFQGGKYVSSSYFIPQDRMDAHKASIYCGFVHSYPFVSNTALSFLLIYFYSTPVSTILPPYKNCEQIPNCTSVMTWYLTLVYYSVLQFHHAIPSASVFLVILSLIFRLVVKLVVPLMFWVLHWLIVWPSSPSWSALPIFHWLRCCSWSILLI